MVKNIDFHAHILPGMDHGCKNCKMSEKQLEIAGKYGVNRIVATPHFYAQEETVDSFLQRRKEAILEITKSRDIENTKYFMKSMY
ncbi:hypothetical protein LJC58_09505 [Lachnospiraceae bacterium OttesenSCG-928-D06]|nr:hypothetical protein [Lachnospiraceae bacterium OttesenSCG-928-D06]